nr:hypothetical protein [Saccharopolyspora spinosa]
MAVDRPYGDAEVVRDLAVVVPLGEPAQHVRSRGMSSPSWNAPITSAVGWLVLPGRSSAAKDAAVLRRTTPKPRLDWADRAIFQR